MVRWSSSGGLVEGGQVDCVQPQQKRQGTTCQAASRARPGRDARSSKLWEANQGQGSCFHHHTSFSNIYIHTIIIPPIYYSRISALRTSVEVGSGEIASSSRTVTRRKNIPLDNTPCNNEMKTVGSGARFYCNQSVQTLSQIRCLKTMMCSALSYCSPQPHSRHFRSK